jgi:hypothetical protein
MVERRSCGCAQIDAIAGERRDAVRGRSFEAALMERRAVICAELSRSARGAMFGAGGGWEERLLAALISDLTQQDSTAFISALDQIVVRMQRAGGEVRVCHAVLTTLRRAILDCGGSDAAVVARADDILHASREMLGESMVRIEIARRHEMLHQVRELTAVAARLLDAGDRAALASGLEARFRGLGVASMALGVFTERGQVTEHCLCLAAYGKSTQGRTIESFPAGDFGPPDVVDDDHGPMLVQPLLFGEEPMGILTCALGIMDGTVHEQMRETLGVGLKGFRLGT